jgi:AraC family transcriptional regulator, transcriptional activator of pobA
MTELFKIYRVDAAEAERIAASPNTPHFHDFEELLIGMEGRLEHFIDFKASHFNAPYISFVTKGKLHQVKPTIADGKCSIWVMRFKTEFLPESSFRLYSYYHDHATIELTNDDGFARMAALCDMMYGEMHRDKPNLAVARDLLKALFTMIEAEEEHFSTDGQPIPKTQNTTFQNFLKILEENFRRPEGVDFYAEKLFMSARNLNLVCNNILHKSVSEIIETRKLIEAQNLLIYSDRPVSDIGFELGYSEKAYFTSVFKKRIKQTPTEFRAAMHRLIS